MFELLFCMWHLCGIRITICPTWWRYDSPHADCPTWWRYDSPICRLSDLVTLRLSHMPTVRLGDVTTLPHADSPTWWRYDSHICRLSDLVTLRLSHIPTVRLGDVTTLPHADCPTWWRYDSFTYIHLGSSSLQRIRSVIVTVPDKSARTTIVHKNTRWTVSFTARHHDKREVCM